MFERKELNKLVILTLKTIDFYPTAYQIYETIKSNNPVVFKDEHVHSFRSFVKVLNSFEQIEAEGPRPMIYKLVR